MVKKERVNFTVDMELMKMFRSYCEEHHLKMSQSVERLIKWELGVLHHKMDKDERHSGVL